MKAGKEWKRMKNVKYWPQNSFFQWKWMKNVKNVLRVKLELKLCVTNSETVRYLVVCRECRMCALVANLPKKWMGPENGFTEWTECEECHPLGCVTQLSDSRLTLHNVFSFLPRPHSHTTRAIQYTSDWREWREWRVTLRGWVTEIERGKKHIVPNRSVQVMDTHSWRSPCGCESLSCCDVWAVTWGMWHACQLPKPSSRPASSESVWHKLLRCGKSERNGKRR